MSSAALVALAACAHAPPPAPAAVPPAGIAIAIYSGATAYSVVDDRRWVELEGDTLVLDHVDPGAALASLVIEPLAGGALHIGRCERDRIPHFTLPKAQRDARPTKRGAAPDAYVPVVRCAITGAHGRYLVRVLYVSTQLGYRAEHDVAMTAPDRATVASRYAIATPPWSSRAFITLFDGMPGGEHVPVELARGEVALDGTTAVLAVPPHEVPARLRRVFRTESADSAAAVPVWVWLELPHAHLPPGLVHAHVELPDEGTRDAELAAQARDQTDAELRLRMWPDDTLRGMRQRTNDYREGSDLAERVVLSVSNTGTVAREVWLEDRLRKARFFTIERVFPGKVTSGNELVRARVTVQPGKVEHVGFTVAYAF